MKKIILIVIALFGLIAIAVDQRTNLLIYLMTTEGLPDLLEPKDEGDESEGGEDVDSKSSEDSDDVEPESSESNDVESTDDETSQEAIVLNSQNFETDEKLIKFATLQEQLDLQYEGHENYGDKLVKVSG